MIIAIIIIVIIIIIILHYALHRLVLSLLILLLFCVCVSPNKVQFYVSTAIFCILAVNAKKIIIKK